MLNVRYVLCSYTELSYAVSWRSFKLPFCKCSVVNINIKYKSTHAFIKLGYFIFINKLSCQNWANFTNKSIISRQKFSTRPTAETCTIKIITTVINIVHY
jgi:hypothetical protein